MNSGCRQANGKATCFCLPGYEGEPPNIPCNLPQNPCDPSPCGPNTQCSVLSNGFSKCTCVNGYIESPNTIRGCVLSTNQCEPNPCGINAICDMSRKQPCICPERTVGNPYIECVEPLANPVMCQPGPCGINADCYVEQNREKCYCQAGYYGDAYSECKQIPVSLCNPNPCGPGADCIQTQYDATICKCQKGLSGDPSSATGCYKLECRTDDDCSNTEACIGSKCRDPCPGACGIGAHCISEKHHPVCFCDSGLTGNPLTRCSLLDFGIPHSNLCMPSPCGFNTECHLIDNKAVCKCLPNFNGNPETSCQPECVTNSDCASNEACINRKCTSPCNKDVCGINAECEVLEHSAVCKCITGYVGDAFIQCKRRPVITDISRDPCEASPCGPRQVCTVYGSDIALCDPCIGENAIHDPQCRPECLSNSDCSFNKACIRQICSDPCPGSCGHGAVCNVVMHNPICSCPLGTYGNSFEYCNVQILPSDEPANCNAIKCGSNTECKERDGVLACICKKDFIGDPLLGCRPECVINTDCPSNKACITNKCIDPCNGVCGINAKCDVVNHSPVCYCPESFTGDALVSCSEFHHTPVSSRSPCDPNPCGPNSRCKPSSEGYAICSCLPNYRGSSPNCQPECTVNAECAQNRACVNLKCVDPCVGTCGIGARCEVIGHNAICSCPPGQSGDPFIGCKFEIIISDEGKENVPHNPCSPSPCGPNSICQIKQNRAVCSCSVNYIGSPPRCRPECIHSSDCPQDKACIREKCDNPCLNACGVNAECHVVAHSAYCACSRGFEGDAFIGCSQIPVTPIARQDPCNPSPCGTNTQCLELNGSAKCSCIPPYIGDPYSNGCRPECVLNADCPKYLSCSNQHCRDPCPGLCGSNAECSVTNHIPVCSCSEGFIGDPFNGCRRKPIIGKIKKKFLEIPS